MKAHPEHLRILRDGVDAWNNWRFQHPDVVPNLSGADLSGLTLDGINFSDARLHEADLHNASLCPLTVEHDYCEHVRSPTYLNGADLTHANLSATRLEGAKLDAVNLSYADLSGADLSRFWPDPPLSCRSDTILRRANLTSANLTGARMVGVDLRGAFLVDTILDGTYMPLTEFGGTVIACDLSVTQKLAECVHAGPSSLDVRKTRRAFESLPEVFLQGCGLADWEIVALHLQNDTLTQEQLASLHNRLVALRSAQPFQLRPLFISYSHKDSAFVDALEPRLASAGIRFWRDIHDVEAGPLEQQVANALTNCIVLIVLSKHSVNSDWVEWEVRTARDLGKQQNRHTMCPLALDSEWKAGKWPQRLRVQLEEFAILDFTNWRDDDAMRTAFGRLESGLHKFYQ